MLDYEYKKHDFEKLKFKVYQRVSKEFLVQGIDVDYDFVSRDFIIQMKYYLYGQSKNGVEVKYPIDWFQAIKERFCPEFLLKKYPVKYNIVIVDFKVLYPDFKPIGKVGDYEIHTIVERFSRWLI